MLINYWSMTNEERTRQALTLFGEPEQRERYFELYSDDVVLHGHSLAPGLESVRNYYRALWAAFPDARVEAEDIFESVDKTVVRFVMRGTHSGPFLGMEATGRSITLHGITILRFSQGKCVERWSVMDGVSLRVQLGAISA